MIAYSHRRVQRPCNLVVLLESGTASQDLRQPELTNSTLHVPDLSLRRCRCSSPLRGLPANTTYHVGMCEGLGSALADLWLAHMASGLRNLTVQTGCAIGNDEVVGVATLWTASARTWPGGERGRHNRWPGVVDRYLSRIRVRGCCTQM